MADITAADVSVSLLTRPGRRIVEGVKQAYADITFGNAALNYPAGGIPLPDLSVFGLLKDCFFITIENAAGLLTYQYVRATHKLMMIWGDYSASADGPHTEYAGAPAQTTLRLKLEGN